MLGFLCQLDSQEEMSAGLILEFGGELTAVSGQYRSLQVLDKMRLSGKGVYKREEAED